MFKTAIQGTFGSIPDLLGRVYTDAVNILGQKEIAKSNLKLEKINSQVSMAKERNKKLLYLGVGLLGVLLVLKATKVL